MRERDCVCVSMEYVCERDSVRVCECVCERVCERERLCEYVCKRETV